MEKIIEWCNANAGFLTGVQTLLTSIISIAAVFVTIQTAREPYVKRLHLINWAIDDDERGQVLYLFLTNTGHVPISISRVVATESLCNTDIKELGKTDWQSVMESLVILPEETKEVDVVFGDIEIDHMYGKKESKIKLSIEIKGRQRPMTLWLPWIFG